MKKIAINTIMRIIAVKFYNTLVLMLRFGTGNELYKSLIVVNLVPTIFFSAQTNIIFFSSKSYLYR